MGRLFVFVCLMLLSQANVSGWSYHGSNGPDNWKVNYPKCGARKQSPINIMTGNLVPDENLNPFNFKNYNQPPSTMLLKNNGHTAQVDLPSDHNMELTGGGLAGTYIPAQFHFHWGSGDGKGSEHVVNSKSYPMEVHFVHYNKKYGSLGAAADKDDGLAVLGFFFQVASENSTAYAPVVNALGQITYKSQNTTNMNGFTLNSLFAQDLSTFYRYSGSLTTPPCHESVSFWTVFPDTIPMSSFQLAQFRLLDENNSTNPVPMVDNFRPPQPLFGRQVKVTTRVKQTECPVCAGQAALSGTFSVIMGFAAYVLQKLF